MADVRGARALGIDCEGERLSRAGRACLLQVGSATISHDLARSPTISRYLPWPLITSDDLPWPPMTFPELPQLGTPSGRAYVVDLLAPCASQVGLNAAHPTPRTQRRTRRTPNAARPTPRAQRRSPNAAPLAHLPLSSYPPLAILVASDGSPPTLASSSTRSGRRSSRQTSSRCTRPSMTLHDLPWPSMVFHDLPRPSMAFRGLPRPSMAVHDVLKVLDATEGCCTRLPPRRSDLPWAFHDLPWAFRDLPLTFRGPSMTFRDLPLTFH